MGEFFPVLSWKKAFVVAHPNPHCFLFLFFFLPFFILFKFFIFVLITFLISCFPYIIISVLLIKFLLFSGNKIIISISKHSHFEILLLKWLVVICQQFHEFFMLSRFENIWQFSSS